MRLKPVSLVTLTLLLLTGCSASRQSRHVDSDYAAPEAVPLPMRHADEYDSGQQYENYDYQYETAPSQGRQTEDPKIIAPPSQPMREPVPAPPAIGVSRVKSVSLLRGCDNDQSHCGDTSSSSGCANGTCSPFPSDDCSEGCINQPLPCREKTTLVDVVRGWNLRRRSHTTRPVYEPQICGEQLKSSPGCFAPGGCSAVDRHHHSPTADHKSAPSPENRGGSLAEPLSADGWNSDGVRQNAPGFSPDELMELPSNINPVPDAKPNTLPAPPRVPATPSPNATPNLPLPETDVPGTPTPTPVEQPVTPDSVQRAAKPPMWPRLGQPTPQTLNVPVAAPAQRYDQTLPLIEPGRRI